MFKFIPFNKPPVEGKYQEYLKEAIIVNNKLSGDGPYNNKCQDWIKTRTNSSKVLTTTSCTHALEMAAILCDIKPGDEVIAPSYTFVSTVNAFVLRGAVIVFVDIRPDTMNMDERLIESAITSKTKAIIPVHYAGVSCNMDFINNIAVKNNLYVIEDAAQGVMALYNGKALGSMGDLGTYSFHETKNYSMGEGGALLINNDKFSERAEIIREKGTNRSKFFQGQVDKYTWVDIGSSYLPSELCAAYLYSQLESADRINKNRIDIWQLYHDSLFDISDNNLIDLPFIPSECEHNAHMFYIKVKDLKERTKLLGAMKNDNILGVFHYIPLHSSKAGKEYGRFNGDDIYTTKESERIIRLPLYYKMEESDTYRVINLVRKYYGYKEL